MSDAPQSAPKLEVFISYATEDAGLAIALHKALTVHLGNDFANVWIDREGIRAGFDLNDEIRRQLDKTDILIVVFTGQQKESHGFTGLEIGYFMAKQRSDPDLVPRRIVSFYLEQPPSTTTAIKGLSFGITKADLAMNRGDYGRSIENVKTSDGIPLFVRSLENDISAFRKRLGLQPVDNNIDRILITVRALLMDVFDVLRKRKETEVNPQKKFVLEISQDISVDSLEVPGSAIITPEGGAMGIFGHPDEKITWNDFLSRSPDKYRPVWKDAIETTILSSLERLEVDNSQMVISSNSQDLYRILLSRRIKFYDDRREFHLYFVEVLKRRSFGDEKTTRLLNALGLCCRFRFMFFEKVSDFSAYNFLIRKVTDARDRARRLVRELNLLKRDTVEAGLDDPALWADLIDWETVGKMAAAYQPIEDQIMEAAGQLLILTDPPAAEGAKAELVNAIRRLDGEFRLHNAALIKQLAIQISVIPKELNLPQGA